MKILIAGDGKVGATLTSKLSCEGHDITLIDSNQEVLDSIIEKFDVMSVHGNCASMDVLSEAGVESADLLIAATSADEVNLLCCMTAHGLNPSLHTIARIRNPEYNEQIHLMRDVFALSLPVNPEKQAALEIERILKYPGFLKRDTFAKGRVEIVELHVGDKSRLCDAPLYKIQDIVKCQILVCTVIRDGEVYTPDGEFVLKKGDRIFVTAPAENLTVLLKNLGIITHKVKHVILAGGGRLGYYLADRLLKIGISVKIIEQNYNRCLELSGLLSDANVVHGDASNQAVLESEGIAECDALVSMTGLDELNMIISLYGKSRGVDQIITKLGRTENTDIINSMLMGSVICPKELCCNSIIRYVRAMQNQEGAAVAVHLIADSKAEAIEFTADENTRFCSTPLKNIKLRRGVLIVCITRGIKTIIPNGESTFKKGDTVIVVTAGGTVIRQLNDIFE